MLRYVIAFLMLGLGTSFASAQATSTASRLGDLQIGAGYIYVAPDYGGRIPGYMAYADFDFRSHWGAEFEIHQANNSDTKLYERTYEWGGRYMRHYGRATPYVKALYGRGVLNYPQNYANIAYNLIAGAGGVDLAVHPRVNVRVDFEYQDWFSGPGIVHGLSPALFTIGAAYHFGPGSPH